MSPHPPAGFARLRLERIDSGGLLDVTLLSQQEQQHLDSMSNHKRRRQFIAGRVLARRLIATLDGADPKDITIEVGISGKPILTGRPDVHFSISHSGDWVGCALASVPVGLDIEHINPRRAPSELIEQVCSPEEQQLFQPLDDESRSSLFTELWTLKEAWHKRQGRPLDMSCMRTVRWAKATGSDANCASWITSDALALSVLGSSPDLLTDQPMLLRQAPCTTRKVEDA